MKTRSTKILAFLLPALALAACASNPTATEQEFGDSVRNMVRAQIADPNTISNPNEEAIVLTDGQMLGGTLEAYRQTIADPASASEEITISLGQ